ncbi:hypothetical protein SUGI_0780210 [Cryptomeria japonica]|nr:hypothetical protein SUGI_0780210 [Cryptomeria japonica]
MVLFLPSSQTIWLSCLLNHNKTSILFQRAVVGGALLKVGVVLALVGAVVAVVAVSGAGIVAGVEDGGEPLQAQLALHLLCLLSVWEVLLYFGCGYLLFPLLLFANELNPLNL